MKKSFLIVVCLSIFSNILAQKTNPILFFDLGLGYAKEINNSGGIIQYGSINYEKNKNLFTARYSEFNQLSVKAIPITPVTPIPFPSSDFKNTEVGILYGRRFIEDNFAYSFSVGISTNKYEIYKKDDYDKTYTESKNYAGCPFEISIKWFKSEKSPYRIYELIPVGKSTALGNSVGFKFLGNISKHSFMGIGLDFGIGYHKEY